MGSCQSQDITSNEESTGCSKTKVPTPQNSEEDSRGISKEQQVTIIKKSEPEPNVPLKAEDGHVVNMEALKELESNHKKKSNFVVGPGYASGASSDFSTSTSGELNETHNGSANGGSDVLGLSTIKSELPGDLIAVRLETPFGRPIEEFYDGVHDGPVLGSGVSGIVRLCTHRATGVKYAVKCLDIGLIQTEAGLRQLRNEISIMCQLDHPNIVELEEVYESTDEIYLVQELCLGGDLFDRLDEQSDYHYSEAQCARLVKQMLSALRYLHSKEIIHRDLKLENFLFSTKDAESELKMIDFGLSKHFFNGQVHSEKVGTPYTVAPEIIRGAYDEKSDIWAMGVITYLLLSGETPFGGIDGENLLHVKDNILRGTFLFEPEDIWANVSDLGKQFVKTLLNPDQANRPTAKMAQLDPWLQIWAKKDVREAAKLNPNTISSLVQFKEYSDMRKLLYEVLSFCLLPEQIAELRNEFQKMDTDGDGEISLTSLKQVLLDNAVAGSLGALTEEEVEDIFNALRVRKNVPTIRWHEFIAAGLSQCKVDDRNLRLAFDRLDNDRDGFIDLDDMLSLVPDSVQSRESLRRMWADSVEECKGSLGRITYENFLILMKGQTNPAGSSALRHSNTGNRESTTTTKESITLVTVPESLQEERTSTTGYDSNDSHDSLRSPDGEGGITSELENFLEAQNEEGRKEQGRCKSVGSKEKMLFHPKDDEFNSYDDEDETPELLQRKNSLRVLVIPDRTGLDIEKVIKDESKTPLFVNRALYRKHREFRLAVLEASKKFDSKLSQSKRDLPGKKANNAAGATAVIGSVRGSGSGAGLIMRRGYDTPAGIEEAHQRAMFEAAAKRAGRSICTRKSRRKKTASDITGMMNGAGMDVASMMMPEVGGSERSGEDNI